jgi:fructose transport system substrate-binding protein
MPARSTATHDSQVAAIETCIADGAKGILIAASDTKAIVDPLRRRGKPACWSSRSTRRSTLATAADATFATDNLEAGKLIGAWAAATLGDKAKDAKIGFLDLTPSQPTVDVLRDQGFMIGFGIDPKDPNKIGDEDDPRIVGHDVTNGNEEGGRKAMENLLQKDSGINVIHTINEPAAVGAYQALKAVGLEGQVLIVSVDGGCPGVKSGEEGVIGATSQQYPLLMAALGIEAIAQFAKDGTKPKPTEGKDFFDTGVNLVTDKPVEGVKSIDIKEGTDKCWG